MRPPEFWRGGARTGWAPPMLEWLLTPPSWVYAAAVARRQQRQGLRLPIPVISVGGVSLGGSGKTPATRAIRRLLLKRGLLAATLSRGHGGSEKGPLQVDRSAHTADRVGDEPLLHAQDGPAWIARSRAAGGLAACQAGVQALVLDDAHQNPSIAKDLRLLVLDGEEGLGNGRLFPAGPLREPLSAALARTDAIILTRPGPPLDLQGKPLLQARVVPSQPPPAGALVAFAGIAFPERFRTDLQAAGGDVVELVAFPDHHRFTSADLVALQALSKRHQASLVTTEKDFVRLPADWRARVKVFRIELEFEAPQHLETLLSKALGSQW